MDYLVWVRPRLHAALRHSSRGLRTQKRVLQDSSRADTRRCSRSMGPLWGGAERRWVSALYGQGDQLRSGTGVILVYAYVSD
jgi:hypothetical protein